MRQGYIFTGVCDSVHGGVPCLGGSAPGDVPGPGRSAPGGGVPCLGGLLPGGAWYRAEGQGAWSGGVPGWYPPTATAAGSKHPWNAFLFTFQYSIKIY